MRAVILAAGVGARLGGAMHKALSPVAPGVTLLSNQLTLLAPLVGRSGILVVVGHEAGAIRRAAAGAAFVENPCFATTNTAKSLLLALRAVDDDVLVLNADLYFEEAALRRLAARPVEGSRALVRSGAVDAEGVGYEAGADGRVAAIGKGLAAPAGEALGMNLLRRTDRAALVRALDQVSDGAYFEDAIQLCLERGEIRLEAVDAGDAYCREVDFRSDLAAVRAAVARRGRESGAGRTGVDTGKWLPRSVALYGVGHFGYALLRRIEEKASASAEPRVRLRVFDRDDAVRRSLRDERRHPYYAAESALASEVEVAESVGELLDGADTLVLAVMSSATREVAAGLVRAGWREQLCVVNTAKALDAGTGKRLSEVFRSELASSGLDYVYGALAGGTIAEDLLRHEPLGMTVACESPARLAGLRWVFASANLWVEASRDLAGVEFAGAFKNVIAICAGMVRGMGLSVGAETHLISRMASEVEEFCVTVGGANRETFSIGSQCWGSDLWMSCTGATRNRALGETLGRGVSLEAAQAGLTAQRRTVEGVQTLGAMRSLLREYPGELPLLRAAAGVVLDGEPPAGMIRSLMRDPLEGSLP